MTYLRYLLIYNCFQLSITLGGAQQVIAEGLPGCLDGIVASAGMACGGGTSTLGFVGTNFVVRNIDGIGCCPGGASGGGDFEGYFEFANINICAYDNVGITMDYEGVLLNGHFEFEDNSPSSPLFGCNAFSNSHDQIVFYYSVDGGPFVQSLYVHGNTEADFTGTWTVPPTLNGDMLTIRVKASTKAGDEELRFSNLRITGSASGINAGPNDDICAGQPYTMMGSGCGQWTGGAGSFSNPNTPNATYNHAPSEVGNLVNLTYTGLPATPGCGAVFPPPSDQMQLFVNILEASISGGGNLCPGQCAEVEASFIGGSFPYTTSFTFSSGGLAFPFVFPMSFDVDDKLTICYGTGLQPMFDQGSNTLTLPSLVGGFGGTLTLTSVSDGTCNGTVTGSGVSFTFNQQPVGQTQTVTSCDFGGGQGFFDLGSVEFDILNGVSGSVSFFSDMALTMPITTVYVGNPGILYALITDDNGCESAPIPITLELLSGEVGNLTFTCNGGQNCLICDDDGVLGETITLNLSFQNPNSTYEVEIISNINGTMSTNTYTVSGLNPVVNFTINGPSSFQVLSVTESGQCVDDNGMPALVNVQYLLKPELNTISPLTSCDTVFLPSFTGTNLIDPKYSQFDNGSGISYAVGQSITTTTTLFAIDGVYPDCYDADLVLVLIDGTITLTAPPNDTACGMVILPTIPNQPPVTTVAYYTDTNGGGTMYQPGDTLFVSDTLYLHDPNANCPSNEPLYIATITNNITYDSLLPLNSCDFVILDTINGQGVTDSVRYYTMPFGLGQRYAVGDTIYASDTLYVWDRATMCNQDSVTQIINIGVGSSLVVPNDTLSCEPFVLLPIAGSSTAAYFTGPNGSGIQYSPGDTVLTPTWLYLFDPASSCNTSMDSFFVEAYPLPIISNQRFVNVCNQYTLEPVLGTGLLGTEYYTNESVGTGIEIPIGTIFTSDTVVYIHSRNGNCRAATPIIISIANIDVNSQNITFCNDHGIIDLGTALTPSGINGVTYTSSSSLNLATAPMLNTTSIAPGNYTIEYRVMLPGCPPDSGSFQLRVLAVPDLGVDRMLDLCIGSSSFPLSSLHDPTVGNLAYSTNAPSALVIPNFDPSGLSVGSYNVRVIASSTSNGVSCRDTSDAVINIEDKPSAGDDIGVSLCQGQKFSLSGTLMNNDAVGQFYFENNTTPIPGDTLTVVGAINTSNNILHILPAAGGCPGDTAVITVTINEKADAGLDANGGVCATGNLNLLDYVNSPDMSGTFELISGNGFSINGNTLRSTLFGQARVRYIVGDQLCGRDTAIITINVTPNYFTEVIDTTCRPNYVFGNITLTPNNPDTTILGQTIAGCDSTVSINITFLPPAQSDFSQDICEGDSILINGSWYGANRPSGTEVFFVNGCDSTVNIQLNILRQSTSDIDFTTCDTTYSLVVGNTTFDRNNPTGIVMLTNSAGCDSMINVNLTITPFDVDFEVIVPECEEDQAMLVITDLNGINAINANINGAMSIIEQSNLPLSINLNIGNYTYDFATLDGLCQEMGQGNIDPPVSPDVTIVSEQLSDSTFQLAVEGSTEVTTFFWTTLAGELSCWDCPDPIHTGTGEVTLIYDYGIACVSNTSITLETVINNDFYLPNAISLNSDNGNDVFIFFASADNNTITIKSFRVYDRWGNVMTSLDNIKPQGRTVLWDGTSNGKDVTPGVYIYTLELDIDGQKVNKQGDITVIR